LPVVEAQIIQESLDHLRVRYVPDAAFADKAAHSIVERLQARLGDIQVILESVPEIPREKNGKFRAVICQLSEEEKRKALQRSH
jgi:phenylacetate-CoA ligase